MILTRIHLAYLLVIPVVLIVLDYKTTLNVETILWVAVISAGIAAFWIWFCIRDYK